LWLGWMTRGQMLTIPMVIGGLALLIIAYARHKQVASKPQASSH